MGFYIQGPTTGKAQYIIKEYLAEPLHHQPLKYEPPKGKVFVCVVTNITFDAAAVCVDKEEFERFTRPDDRPKKWLLMDKAQAYDLTEYDGGD